MSSITLVRRIAASANTVFDAISTPEGIAQWWGPDDGPVLFAEFDPRIGGPFKVRFQMRDGSEHECSGEVLEVERPSRLVFSWQWHGDEADGESRIEISLRPVGDAQCELTFSHRQLPDDERTAKGHERGWNGSLDKLERHLRQAGGSR